MLDLHPDVARLIRRHALRHHAGRLVDAGALVIIAGMSTAWIVGQLVAGDEPPPAGGVVAGLLVGALLVRGVIGVVHAGKSLVTNWLDAPGGSDR